MSSNAMKVHKINIAYLSTFYFDENQHSRKVEKAMRSKYHSISYFYEKRFFVREITSMLRYT